MDWKWLAKNIKYMAFKLPNKNIGAIQKATSTLPTQPTSTAPINPMNPISAKASATNTGMTGEPTMLKPEEFTPVKKVLAPNEFTPVKMVGEQQPQEENVGLVKGIVRGIANPLLKVGLTAKDEAKGVYSLARYNLANLMGDEKSADKFLNEMSKIGETVDMGYFGKIAPVGFEVGQKDQAGMPKIKDTADFAKDAAGTFLESAATLYGGGEGAGVIKTGLKGLIKQGAIQGAKSGAITGLLSSTGQELQKSESTPQSILKSGATGATVGGLVGGTIGATIPLIKGGMKTLTKGGKFVKDTTERIGRKIEQTKIENAVIEQLPKEAQDVINVGIPKKEVARIMTSPKNKPFYQKILDYAEKSEKDPRFYNRPEEVVGKQVSDVIDFFDKTRINAGNKLGEISRNLSKEVFDNRNNYYDFVDKIEQMGVKIEKKGGKVKLNFDDSSFGQVDADKKLLQFVYDKLSRGANPYQMQLDRQAIEHSIFNSKDPISSNARIIAYDVAESYGNVLSQLSKDYAKNNAIYSATRSGIDDFYKSIGQQWKGESGTIKNIKIGEILNRLSSNASGNTLKLLNDLQQTAKFLGYNIEGNIPDQVEFLNLVKQITGQIQKTSLAGQTNVGISKGEILKKGLDYITQKTPEEQIRALRLLLDKVR